jgi:hypothetical protein
MSEALAIAATIYDIFLILTEQHGFDTVTLVSTVHDRHA